MPRSTKTTTSAKSNHSVSKQQNPPGSQKESTMERAFPIVGIGASAGGFEAFSAFLKHVSESTGAAYVYIQHQNPTHKSNLTDLLSRIARIPVILAEDRMRVEPNHVYVLPPNADLHISNGLLRIMARRSAEIPHLPVDMFFRSLAENSKRTAIGVILSGTASDGTLGLKAIKAEGGITFAQNEETAKYGGMPSNAIAADVVDYVLPVEKIAREIARIATHPLVRSESELDEKAVSDKSALLAQIFSLIRKVKDVDFTHYKSSTILRRIGRRMLVHKSETLEDFVHLLKENPKYVTALYEDILINVTSFFRDPEIFDILKHEIFPKLSTPASEKIVRIWVPGCSTGEEAYSLAVAFYEYLSERGKRIPIQIFATDISENAIEKARVGFYPFSISSDVSPERLRRFFTITEHGYQINKFIRELCVFAHHNVVKDAPFSKMDLISCRNLLIYLGPVLQKKLMPLFHYALNPEGYLILGSSESIGGFSDFFFPADRKYKVYSTKTIPSRMQIDLPEKFEMDRNTGTDRSIHSEEAATEKDVLKEGDRLILKRFAPASVIVNENFEILQFRGRTGLFFEHAPGQASFNIMKMAKEGFMGELTASLIKAKRDKTTVRKENLEIVADDKIQRFHLEISPFTLPRSTQYFYLVLFETIENRSTESKKRKTAKHVFARGKNAELERLAAELSNTKDYLQSIIEEQEATNEELRAANEEILSSNEELQSTNEEIETAKEELQSSNEELTTVNEELQVRNSELQQVNNDLNNLLGSVNIPILMLSRDLRIRRFTPIAAKVLRLISSDVGRPITDIMLNMDISDLSKRIENVIDTVEIEELEVQNRDGQWFILQIRPYKTLENKIEGALLVLIDIDLLKKHAGILTTIESVQAVVETALEPFLVLDSSYRVVMANRPFCDTFKTNMSNLDENSFFEIEDGRWNISKLKSVISKMKVKGIHLKMETIRVEHNLGELGKRTLIFNIQPFRENDQVGFLLAVKDLH